MPTYKVEGYEKIAVWMTVEADSEEDAVNKAWNGKHNGDVDTDPIGKIDKNRWTANPVD